MICSGDHHWSHSDSRVLYMLQLMQAPPSPSPSKENHKATSQRSICAITSTWAPFYWEGTEDTLGTGQQSPGPPCAWDGPNHVHNKQKEQSRWNIEIIENRLLLRMENFVLFWGEGQDRIMAMTKIPPQALMLLIFIGKKEVGLANQRCICH